MVIFGIVVGGVLIYVLFGRYTDKRGKENRLDVSMGYLDEGNNWHGCETYDDTKVSVDDMNQSFSTWDSKRKHRP